MPLLPRSGVWRRRLPIIVVVVAGVAFAVALFFQEKVLSTVLGLLEVLALVFGLWERRPSTGGQPVAGRIFNPATRIRSVVGREEDIRRLERALGDGDGVTVVALYGMGGVGKSTLASEYAYRHREEMDLALFIDASAPASITARLASLAAALGIEAGARQEDAAHAALRALAGHEGRWLLVFEDAPEPSTVEDWLPRDGRGQVIITSRSRGWDRIATALKVDVLARETAAGYLCAAACDDDRTSALALADALGGLPIALELAAGYCAAAGTKLARYAEMFGRKGLVLLAAADTTAAERVTRLWQPSMRRLAEQDPAALELLRFLACLAPGVSPRDLATRAPETLPAPLADCARDRDHFDRAIASLLRVSLIGTTDEGHLRVHELVQLSVWGDVAAGNGPFDQTRWVSAAVTALAAATAVHGRTYDHWETLTVLLPHVELVIARADELGIDTLELATVRFHHGRFLHDSGHLKQARKLYERAVADRTRLLGADHIDTVIATFWLVRLGRHAERSLEDLAQLEQTLAVGRRELGVDHPDTLGFARELARVLFRLNRFREAREVSRDTLERGLRVLGEEDIDVILNMTDHGMFLRGDGDLGGAIAMHRRALAAASRALPPNDPVTWEVTNNLAFALDISGEAAEAWRLHDGAYQARRAVLGERHPQTLISRNNRARADRKLGNLSRARTEHQAVLQIRQEVLAAEHQSTLVTMVNLAEVHQAQGDLDAARDLLVDVVRIRRRNLGDTGRGTLLAVNLLAEVLRARGELDEAAKLHEEALAARIAAHGADHVNTATSQYGLAEVRRAQEDLRTARDLHVSAHATRFALLGVRHPDTRESTRALSAVLDQLGLSTEARRLRADAAEGGVWRRLRRLASNA